MEFDHGAGRVRVNMTDRAALLAEVSARLGAGRGFALATLNLDHLVKLPRDGAFRDAYAAQDLVTADGNPVVWLARLAGREMALLPGSDLITPLAELAAAQGVPVALIGGTEASLKAAAGALEARVPGLRVAARIAPPMGFDPEGAAADAALDALAASGARLVFVALGAPKQERLAARGRARHSEIGFVSIGAGLDFIAGTQRRAPRLVRRLALEWLWRAASDPARLAGRYARCALILPGHAIRAWRMR
ncbi:exopolysaccharide biosynthesis WecB/TagA/CpsF family protein [Limimaricola variabilis]|uniref:Exopolysaccharide biosynthesis WecB/TagA/CpsF family protein n=1 Tax=Limimaricola variabilis TaxID=1492771 RepID=A0ABR6HRD4_9RHOB|nr:WecB/TagA/CpsF family glycosyltransferase [Limimaricola variabilis]MBB3713109.1 exopolysaccharide biosynthesis WecB/TagA/CpsF family protein [Limimaricola variabilis]